MYGIFLAAFRTRVQNMSISVSEAALLHVLAVASLGWVTPGAATEGATPIFFSEKPGDLFCSSLSLSLSLFIAFTRVSPLEGVTPTPFLPVRPRFSTILCKFDHNFFPSGVTPWRVSPGAVPRTPLVTPLCPCQFVCSQNVHGVNIVHSYILNAVSNTFDVAFILLNVSYNAWDEGNYFVSRK